jgi:hypothetical protein
VGNYANPISLGEFWKSRDSPLEAETTLRHATFDFLTAVTTTPFWLVTTLVQLGDQELATARNA